jgi:hypothetical protein
VLQEKAASAAAKPGGLLTQADGRPADLQAETPGREGRSGAGMAGKGFMALAWRDPERGVRRFELAPARTRSRETGALEPQVRFYRGVGKETG